MEYELESCHPVSVCAEIFLQSRDLQSRERSHLGRGSIERSPDARHKSVTTADIVPLS
ncbi:MAG: hypothetical protein ACYTXY_02935 [Nostoc sp.]